MPDYSLGTVDTCLGAPNLMELPSFHRLIQRAQGGGDGGGGHLVILLLQKYPSFSYMLVRAWNWEEARGGSILLHWEAQLQCGFTLGPQLI